MKIQFIGATHEVTGSCTVIEVNGKFYLVDCGMEQGKDIFQNILLPIPANQIEAVFLTHAHIDHSGMLPKLYKDGFCGSVFATDATCDLSNIMLQDSAHIQESEAQWRTKRSLRSGGDPVEPVYTVEDALGIISKFRRCNYGEKIYAAEGIEVCFTDIGHLLGSSCIEMWLKEGNEQRKIVFSGDVGNLNQGIINDPKTVDETDYLVVESTYGNRLHDAVRGDVVSELASHLQRAFDRGGTVIIPSFAVGRTQEMLYIIREIKQKNLVSHKFPVYVDSPLASQATAIFMQCNPDCFDPETRALLNKGINPIWFDDIKITETSEESKLINANSQPKVIISASGMCEAGRIRHHLKHNLWSSKNSVLFVGYQSEHSLGRKLLDGEKLVNILGEEISVNAEICSLRGTSGHADRDGLFNWIKGFKINPQLIFVNHGDDESCEAFKDYLRENGYNADAPFSGTEYDLISGKMTIYTEGKIIDRTRLFAGSARADMVFKDLVSEAEKLLLMAKERRGRPNKDNAKLTSQIKQLIEKWRD